VTALLTTKSIAEAIDDEGRLAGTASRPLVQRPAHDGLGHDRRIGPDYFLLWGSTIPPSLTVVCEDLRTWTVVPRSSDVGGTEEPAKAVELPASAIMAAAATGRMIRTKRRMVVST
jgi:hypothetical protein